MFMLWYFFWFFSKACKQSCMLKLDDTMAHDKPKSRFVPIKPPRDLREGLEKSNILLSNQKTMEALQQLLNLNKKYPNNPEILESMAFAYVDLKNNYSYLETMLQLNKLVSGNEHIKIGLAKAYLINGFQALALQTYRKIINRWPLSEYAKNSQKITRQLELFSAETASKLDFSLEPGLDFFAKHEELQILMYQGKFKRCKKIAADLIFQRPEFAPVRNNLSQISWLEGNLTEAIEITQKVLDFQPENVHALANLCCYFFMIGKKENAIPHAKRLKESKILAIDHWLKKVKALSFIGDDDGVINLLELAKLDRNYKLIDGTFWHWCAVAEYRRGNSSKARTYWNKCIKLAPYFSLAIDNLEELKKPHFDRICPQVYGLETWLPEKIIKDLFAIVDHPSNKKENIGVDIKLDSYFSEHPEILQFIPAAITAGEIFTREFAFQLADMTSDPKTLNWLKVFVLGREGSDSLRVKAAQILSRHGIFKAGEKVKLWLQNDLTSIVVFGFEIVFGPMDKDALKRSARNLAEEAIEALQERNGELAEGYLRKALEIQPDEPTLLNNLAVSLNLQGKVSEANSLADQLEIQFPEYLFGQLIAARKAISAKDFNKAQRILDKLMKKDKLHSTEFSALCSCQVDFQIADKNLKIAFSWLQTWEKVFPEDPSLMKYREIRRMAEAQSKLNDGNFNKSRFNKKPN